jgi:hypothetical protein
VGAVLGTALRPMEAYRGAVCYVRFTSTPAVLFAHIADLADDAAIVDSSPWKPCILKNHRAIVEN